MASVLDRIRHNPALVLAFVAACVQALEAQDVLTWNTVVTVVLGVLIRQFVTPAHEVEDQVAQAYVAGQTDSVFYP